MLTLRSALAAFRETHWEALLVTFLAAVIANAFVPRENWYLLLGWCLLAFTDVLLGLWLAKRLRPRVFILSVARRFLWSLFVLAAAAADALGAMLPALGEPLETFTPFTKLVLLTLLLFEATSIARYIRGDAGAADMVRRSERRP